MAKVMLIFSRGGYSIREACSNYHGAGHRIVVRLEPYALQQLRTRVGGAIVCAPASVAPGPGKPCRWSVSSGVAAAPCTRVVYQSQQPRKVHASLGIREELLGDVMTQQGVAIAVRVKAGHRALVGLSMSCSPPIPYGQVQVQRRGGGSYRGCIAWPEEKGASGSCRGCIAS